MNPSPCQLHTSEDLVLAAPLLLGYWPGNSLCAVLVDGQGSVVLTARWDREIEDLLPLLEGAISGTPSASACHLVSYADGPPEAGPTVAAIDQICASGIRVGQVIMAGREGATVLWSTPELLRSNMSVRAISRDAIGARIHAWRGVSPSSGDPWVTSRAVYVGDIDPVPAQIARVAEAMSATESVTEAQRDAALHSLLQHLTGVQPQPAEVARCLVALGDVPIRDTVLWDLMGEQPATWGAIADRLAAMVAAAPEPHVAPAATLLAILRWQIGDGTRAVAAVERALAADPTYTLAGLVDRCLATGMHPSIWREGLATLTREECRRSA